jgi:ferredoxin/flavodoxin---NADP+ reductase
MSQHRVINKRNLSDSAYVLCFERNGIVFKPGQHIYVGLNCNDNRPYSIYSGIQDDFIEILVKEVKGGNISQQLKSIQPGDYLCIDHPQGSFIIEGEEEKLPIWFIGTGTGISPFHSIVRSYPAINYKIIHGIRYAHEAYDREVYGTGKYLSCTSRETYGDFNGRVTEYLKSSSLYYPASYFLCGNYEMIDEVFDLLIARGIEKNQIKTEGYF